MKRIVSLILALIVTASALCGLAACDEKSVSSVVSSAGVSSKAADVADSSNESRTATGTLYSVIIDEQNTCDYYGEKDAMSLIAALSEATGYAFDVESVDVNGTSAIVRWNTGAAFIPGADAEPIPVEGMSVQFFDYDSLLRYMLDSVYYTLNKNLGITGVCFGIQTAAGLDFRELANWNLPAHVEYHGNFEDYYVTAVE